MSLFLVQNIMNLHIKSDQNYDFLEGLLITTHAYIFLKVFNVHNSMRMESHHNQMKKT